MEVDHSHDSSFEPGLVVETHSLSREELNGKRGYCINFDPTKERWGVEIAGKMMAIKPVNLITAPIPGVDDAEAADKKALSAAHKLTEARRSTGPAVASLITEAEVELAAAEATDPSCAIMLRLRGDLEHMRNNYARMAVYMQRAVINSRGTREEKTQARMGLANALGEAGDMAGEEAQLRAVLKLAPGHIHARFALGNILNQRGRLDDSVPELMMAVQLPNSDPPLPEQIVSQVRTHARQLLCSSLGQSSTKEMEAGNYTRALELLTRLLAVPQIGADETSKGEAHRAMALAKLGRLIEAEEAAERGAAADSRDPVRRAFAVHTAACCKERLADVCTDTAEQATLYAAAKQRFREAHAIRPDKASRLGFERVGAKTHAEIEWTFTPEGSAAPVPAATMGPTFVYQGSGMGGGGLGRPLTAGAKPEPLV